MTEKEKVEFEKKSKENIEFEKRVVDIFENRFLSSPSSKLWSFVDERVSFKLHDIASNIFAVIVAILLFLGFLWLLFIILEFIGVIDILIF